jgi:hypothetical protein
MKTNTRRRSLRSAGMAAAVLLLLPGCDFGLDSVNVDNTRLRAVEPQFQLNDVILGSSPGTGEYRCETSILQQHIRVFTGVGSCGNFNVAARGNMTFHWTGGYNRLRELGVVLAATEGGGEAGSPALQNLHHIARILRAYTVMRITDAHGDVPFSEAAQALEGIVFPAYDDQEVIYTGAGGILAELQSASAALVPANGSPPEILYNGQRRALAALRNSMLLRAAMRLTKVNPGLAAAWAQNAVNSPGRVDAGQRGQCGAQSHERIP